MKILSTKKKKWSYKSTCEVCDTKVILEKSDVRFVDDRDGAAIVYKCPTCSNEVWISAAVAKWKQF